MKIIKPGVVPAYVWTGTCKHCGCMIEAEPCEVKSAYDSKEATSWDTVKCPTPQCGSTINVQKKRNFGPKEGKQ